MRKQYGSVIVKQLGETNNDTITSPLLLLISLPLQAKTSLEGNDRLLFKRERTPLSTNRYNDQKQHILVFIHLKTMTRHHCVDQQITFHQGELNASTNASRKL